jgi:hypothetical protein
VLDNEGLIVKIGLFGRRRIYVPLSDVDRVDETVQAVYLRRIPAGVAPLAATADSPAPAGEDSA